ncbi:MAG TPA: RNA-binding S4 domain-containing protein [Rhodocyclaceae bacterium]|nr:RNA-binding S4 domain-containing protein [Rhodocyclaceae bacterium]
MSQELSRLRLDKWLWAARFFKTRSLATDAIDGGKIKVNGAHAKPAKEIVIGDTLDITAHDQHWTVVIQDLNAQRRPAPEACGLYQETEESRTRRQESKELMRLAPTPGADIKGRPTKRAGRKLRGVSSY